MERRPRRDGHPPSRSIHDPLCPGHPYTEQEGTLVATHAVVLQIDGTLLEMESWSWTNGPHTCSDGTAEVLAEPLSS